MTHYLIEIRLFGKAKYEVKSLIWEVDRRFRLGLARRHRPVPHITVVGPFGARNERRLISDFRSICSKQDSMRFTVRGYGTFDQTRVVYINVKPDEALKGFRDELVEQLKDYCSLSTYDYQDDYSPHITVAMKLRPHQYTPVKAYVNAKPAPEFRHHVLRVTLIKNSFILREYDFFLNSMLSRYEAKNVQVLSKTFDELKQKLESKTDAVICEEATTETEPVEGRTTDKVEDIPVMDICTDKTHNKTFFEKIRSLFSSPKRIFFISDLHLDHTNIIKFCNRPFSNRGEMNNHIVNTWNSTVGESDTVYFLGDMAYGRGSRNADYWINKLNGNIIFIKGNHERARNIKLYDKLILKINDERFFLVHDPAQVPAEWKGWVIHGHIHNNKQDIYPYINKKNKTINVSAEVIEYIPVELKDLLEEIR